MKPLKIPCAPIRSIYVYCVLYEKRGLTVYFKLTVLLLCSVMYCIKVLK